MWVLIIDDDEEDAEFLSDALREIVQDCECVTVSSCETGLLGLGNKKELPSHIFLDGMLYGMSSKECLIKIKTDLRIGSVSVIMYSGFASASFEEEILSLGADFFIQKPTHRADLVNRLKSIFKNDK